MHPFYNPNDQWCLSQNLNSQKMQPFDMDNTTGRSLLESRLSDRHKTKTIVLRLGHTIRDNNRLLYQCRTIKTSCRKGEFRPKITIKVCAQLFNSINEYSLCRITIVISDGTSFANANPFTCVVLQKHAYLLIHYAYGLFGEVTIFLYNHHVLPRYKKGLGPVVIS